MPFLGILSLLLLLLIVVGIVALMRFLFNGLGRGDPVHGRSSGLEVLEERCAKGKIQRDEYLQKKRDLGG